jgi:hypothetical protein
MKGFLHARQVRIGNTVQGPNNLIVVQLEHLGYLLIPLKN